MWKMNIILYLFVQYSNIRQKFIKPFHYKKTSVLKLCQLFTSIIISILKLCKYIYPKHLLHVNILI